MTYKVRGSRDVPDDLCRIWIPSHQRGGMTLLISTHSVTCQSMLLTHPSIGSRRRVVWWYSLPVTSDMLELVQSCMCTMNQPSGSRRSSWRKDIYLCPTNAFSPVTVTTRLCVCVQDRSVLLWNCSWKLVRTHKPGEWQPVCYVEVVASLCLHMKRTEMPKQTVICGMCNWNMVHANAFGSQR